MEVVMVTSNFHKYAEARELAKKEKIILIQKNIDIPEIRGTIEDIVMDKAKKAYKEAQSPVVCEDSGLFIDALNEFPGVFSKFAFQKLGSKGILKLLKGVDDRSAEFRCMSCYFDGLKFYLSLGVVRGEISEEMRGEVGFGFDPIFIPNGYLQTFAEDFSIKMKTSHRKKSLVSLFRKIKKL